MACHMHQALEHREKWMKYVSITGHYLLLKCLIFIIGLRNLLASSAEHPKIGCSMAPTSQSPLPTAINLARVPARIELWKLIKMQHCLPRAISPAGRSTRTVVTWVCGL